MRCTMCCLYGGPRVPSYTNGNLSTVILSTAYSSFAASQSQEFVTPFRAVSVVSLFTVYILILLI